MKRNEILWDSKEGTFLMEPFSYSNGREGYMCTAEDKHTFNLTLNLLDSRHDGIMLKMYGDAEPINRWLLEHTDMFTKVKPVTIGVNYGQIVTLNEKYYEIHE